MSTQRIKTILIKLLGARLMACVEAVAFIYLLRKAKYSDPETQLVSRFLKEGAVAVDVGANGADWTYCLHQHVGDQGCVYAFEADPYYALATGIAIKLMRLKGVHLFPFGLSDRDESVPLRVNNPAGLRFAGLGHIDKSADKNDSGVEVVQLKRLDSLVNEYPRIMDVALIKCDVEGYELFVFKGATRLLMKARPVVILEVGHFEKQGYSARDIYSFFQDKEYCAFALAGACTLVPTNESLEYDAALSVNRILIPKERLATVGDLVKSPSDGACIW